MAELNFGLLTPPGSQSIGNAFVTGMDQAQEARARDLQMQQSVRQGEVTQMQLQKLKQDAAGLAEFSRKVSAMGGPSDPVEIAKAYLNHPDVEMQKFGAGLMQKAQNLAAYKALPPDTATAPPTTTAAPAGQPNALASAAVEAAPVGQPNALAPAAVGVAPVAPTPTVESRLAEIRIKLAKLDPFTGTNGVPAAIREADMLKKEAEELMKSHTVAPGGTLVRAGLPNFSAPPAVSAFETMLANSDLTPEAKVLARKALISKEINIAQPEFIDNLRALAEAKDPATRTFLTNRLNYMTTHAPGTNLSVNTVVPASVEAQKEFMKETRATYGALKQSSAMFENIEAAKKLIPSASAFMGVGGEGMKTAASFLNNRLGMSINTEGVKNATELQSRLFQGIMDNLRKLDAQPSERQQAALQEALGSLATDPKALSNVLDAFADSVRNKIDIHNAEVQSAISRGVKFPYDPIIKTPAKATAGNVTTNPQYPGFSIGKP